MTAFFGTMSIGSALWGSIADRIGMPPALYLAGAGALAAIWLTHGWKLQTGPEADLTPSMHWPEPVLAGAVEIDAGPVLVTVEYRVTLENHAAFLAAITRFGRERRRDGAYARGVFEDTAHPGRMLETFLVDSRLEHLRQHERVTNADRELEAEVRRLVRDQPCVTHYLAAGSR